jgi:PucR family transcriptional regulator, purine catabolism regulatory protein
VRRAGRACRAARVLAAIAEHSGALAEEVDGRVYALVPGSPAAAKGLAKRLGRHGTVGLSSHYPRPAEVRRALEEGELVLEVLAAGAYPTTATSEAAPTGC